jgi:Mg2+ and Co2+ transporter CorA
MTQQDLESRVVRLETKVDEIIDNHLAHIDEKVNWIIGLIVTTLLSVVFFLLKLMVK